MEGGDGTSGREPRKDRVSTDGNYCVMSTTSLFVELVVIGAGAAIWVGLLILAVFGVEWLPAVAASREFALPMLLPALSIMYVLGILVDRLADGIFVRQADRLRARTFPTREDYRYARTLIYVQSDSLKDLFEYNRSRLRICRGWVVNAVLILLTSNLFVASIIPSGSVKPPLLSFGNLAIAVFAFWSWRAWRGLAIGEYAMLYEQRNFLQEAPGLKGSPPSDRAGGS